MKSFNHDTVEPMNRLAGQIRVEGGVCSRFNDLTFRRFNE